MTLAAGRLLREYGSSLAVAEALLLGKLKSYEQEYVPELVSKMIMEAAKFRVEKYLATETVKLVDDRVLVSS